MVKVEIVKEDLDVKDQNVTPKCEEAETTVKDEQKVKDENEDVETVLEAEVMEKNVQDEREVLAVDIKKVKYA